MKFRHPKTIPQCWEEAQEIIKTLDALWKVVKAAERIVRPEFRQSKENAPLEYALWEALEALKENPR